MCQTLTLLRALNTQRRRVLDEYIYNQIEKSISTLRSVTTKKFVRSHRRANSLSGNVDAEIDMDLHRNGGQQSRPASALVKRSKSFEAKSVNVVNHMSNVTEKVQLNIAM